MAPPDRTLVIWNLAAAGGRARRRWPAFSRAAGEFALPFDAWSTEHPGHATALAAEAVRQGYRRVAAFGGDGTLHEVLQGLIADGRPAKPDLELLFLPAGSSCDFAKSFPPRASLPERLAGDQTVLVDLIRIDCHDRAGAPRTRYALNSSNLGLIAVGAERTNARRGLTGLARRISVDAASVAAGLEAFVAFEPVRCRVTVDAGAPQGCLLSNLTVFKSPWIAGGMNFGVACGRDDGLLRLATLRAVPRRALVQIIPALYRGTFGERPEAEVQACRSVVVETEGPVMVEADGELVGFAPVRFGVMPRVVRVVV